MRKIHKRTPVKIRLEKKIELVTESGCWIFLGGCDTNGYGVIQMDGKQVNTHRASWRIYRGEIPEGMHVLHRCDVRCCVNPNHLFLGTQYDNVKDMMAKGRLKNHWHTKKQNIL